MNEKYNRCIDQWDGIFEKSGTEIPKSRETGNAVFDAGLRWLTEQAETVLDFGCGNGTVLLLCSLYGTQKHIGLDLSEKGIENAKLRAEKMQRGEFSFIAGGIEQLSGIKSGSVDAVVLSNIVDNLYPEDAKTLLSEVQRMLRQNGRVLIKLNPFLTEDKIKEYDVKIIEGNLLDDGLILWNNTDEQWRDLIGAYFKIVRFEEVFYPEHQMTNRLFLAEKIQGVDINPMFKVALLQSVSEKIQEENRKKGMALCRQAKAMGADLALFPEMWSNGYEVSSDVDELKKRAVENDGEFVRTFADLAKELKMAIGITYLEAYEPLPRNTLTVFDRFGRRVLTYAKVHTCDFEDERNLTPGGDFETAELDIGNDIVKIGAMICYDREFPESARILMLKGAEVILVPNACPMEQNRLAQLRTRAYENMLGIATANYAYGQPDCNGHSSAYDGIAYGEIRPGMVESRDTLIIEAGECEGIYLAAFPMDKIRDYRRREIHGNAYRRPDKYRLLVSEAREEPFIRSDYRK